MMCFVFLTTKKPNAKNKKLKKKKGGLLGKLPADITGHVCGLQNS